MDFHFGKSAGPGHDAKRIIFKTSFNYKIIKNSLTLTIFNYEKFILINRELLFKHYNDSTGLRG